MLVGIDCKCGHYRSEHEGAVYYGRKTGRCHYRDCPCREFIADIPLRTRIRLRLSKLLDWILP